MVGEGKDDNIAVLAEQEFDKFVQIAGSDKGGAVIFAGSDSDAPHIDKLVKSLKDYNIPVQVRICSAHKEPERLIRLLMQYQNMVDAPLVYIAVAGGADALSGILSFHANGPVISSPPDATPDKPNMSCLANPPGSSRQSSCADTLLFRS